MTIEDTSPQWQDPADLAAPAGVSQLGLTQFLDPLRIPPVIKAGPLHRDLTITARATKVRLHSELPPTRVWAYDGHFPGPTIDVRRGQRLHVAWRNEVKGTSPLTAVDVAGSVITTGPGRDGAAPRPEVAALPPWLVVHLHGARTGAGNDGWTENGVLRGESQLAEYLNDQPATALWYHDHAMAITAFNVMTGLAGMYLIRDEEEDALDLPRGRYEVPLIICDRNLDTDADGAPTGDLLYKLARVPRPPGPEVRLPFTGPYTLVNGGIWPHMEVDARWYRFRMLNTSNARPYRFELLDEGNAPVPGALVQIGGDAGLFPAPAALGTPAAPALSLQPGERADVLVDFSAFRGQTLSLVNTVVLPPGVSPNPDVMQFRVRMQKAHDDFTLPSTISPSFVDITHDTPHEEHRWMVLVALDGRDVEMWEMEETDVVPTPGTATDGMVQVVVPGEAQPLKTLRRVTREFKDPVAFCVEHGAWEQWRFLNLSGFPHPMHIHLTRFQALPSQVCVNVAAAWDNLVGGTTAPLALAPAAPLSPADQGWKDVINVLPNHLVSVIGQFAGGTGRYVHHCHILEHEDMGMMRTFLVMPEEVVAVDPHMFPGGHHHDDDDHDDH
jgi:spore coat protein A